MISDFELLSDKVASLAALTQALRIENAGLRHEMAALTAQNLEMQQRMQQAHDRVAALLTQLPAESTTTDDEEAA